MSEKDIPDELRKRNQWSYSFDIAELKRPKHSHYTPDGSLSFTQAFSYAKINRLSFGFYTTPKDPYVIGDVDHVEDPRNADTLPPYLKGLLTTKGLYSEVSPSGNGVRFVGKLPSVEDKARLNGKVFYPKIPLVNAKEAQINVGPPWLRFTGDATPYSSNEVPVLTTEEWGEVFALKYHEEGTSLPLLLGFHVEPRLLVHPNIPEKILDSQLFVNFPML